MDKAFVCKCGNDKFWFFPTGWYRWRCTGCMREYLTENNILFVREFDNEQHKYRRATEIKY